jgi:hypothetical protein
MDQPADVALSLRLDAVVSREAHEAPAPDEKEARGKLRTRRSLLVEVVAETCGDGERWRARVDFGGGGPFGPWIHAAAAASVWLWSFRRLWVAVIRRHSVRAADLPRR